MTAPPHAPDLRERLDEIIVRALARQQAYAEDCFDDDGPIAEPKSEDVVAEILAVVAPALAEARAALQGLLERYVRMVESGDCGFWDAEEEEVVKAARAALRDPGS